MELDTIVQIVFGVSATLIAILALWFAWRTTRGELLDVVTFIYSSLTPDSKESHLAHPPRSFIPRGSIHYDHASYFWIVRPQPLPVLVVDGTTE
jgi:hypothetical protein